MSIRLRLTLLYSAILALTLIVFGTALYTIQAQETMNSLRANLIQSGNGLAQSILNNYLNPNPNPPPIPPGPPPVPIETLSGDQAFNQLRERVIVRVLDPNGNLVASPFAGQEQDNTAQPLPLSADGLQTLKNKQVWWETSSATGDHLLIFDIPVIYQGSVTFIVQVAQSLSQRDQALAALSSTLIIAGFLTILIAFGIGWIFPARHCVPFITSLKPRKSSAGKAIFRAAWITKVPTMRLDNWQAHSIRCWRVCRMPIKELAAP